MKKQLSKVLLMFFFAVIFSGCKKTVDTNGSNNNAEVNYAGAVATPNATFTPFQIPAGGTTSIPTSYDLAPFMPPVRNQNPQGSCVGFCLAYLKSYHERLEYGYSYTGDDKIMSPAFIYNQAKETGDCMIGTQTIRALNFLKQNGVSTEAEFPYVSNNCTNLPSQTIKNNALRNKIREWQGFNFQNNNGVIDEMKFAISQMQPIVIDFKVDQEFANFNLFSWGTVIWKQNNSGDPVQNGVRSPGYHCALLVGYDDAKNAFKLLNSWGTWWKNDGYCWVEYSWLLQRVRYAFVTFDEFNTASNGTLQVTGSLDFGNVAINTTASKIIQLKNTGTTNINVSSLTLTSPFSTNWSNGTIQPNATTNVTINFNPTSVGAANRTLTINSDATNNPVTVQATGSGVQQTTQTKIISLSGNLSYGNVTTGQSSAKTLTITNTGNSPLIVSSISTPLGFSGNYNGTIQAGNSANVTISFSPSNVQSYSGNIIVNSDATSGTNAISCSGTGTSSGGGGPVVVPAIGTYGNCESTGQSYICSPTVSYGTGIINGRVVSINTSTHQIVIEIKKCNGTAFNAGGNFNVVSGLCSGVSYGFGSFNSGFNTIQMTITDNNMTGTKTYWPFIVQGTSLNILYTAPPIIITY